MQEGIKKKAWTSDHYLKHYYYDWKRTENFFVQCTKVHFDHISSGDKISVWQITFRLIISGEQNLKYGFHNKSFILNAPLVSCPIPVIRFGWVQQQTHPKRMTGIGQLTRGAFRINDLLWNPYFKVVSKVTYFYIYYQGGFNSYIFLYLLQRWFQNLHIFIFITCGKC